MKRFSILCGLLLVTVFLNAQHYYRMWRGSGSSGSPEWLCNSAMWLDGTTGIEFTTDSQPRSYLLGDGRWFILNNDYSSEVNKNRLKNILMPNADNYNFQAKFILDVNLATPRLIVSRLDNADNNVQVSCGAQSAYLDANGDVNGFHIKSNTGKKIFIHDQVSVGTGYFDTAIIPGASLTVSGGVFIGPKNFMSSYDMSSKQDKYLLWVQKGILSENFTLARVTDWSDYVFDNDYILRSPYEVESFIKQNKHLPDIPKEEDIIENGYNIHDMNKLFLQKIEELTLYMIQQQKEIDSLKQQLKQE